MGSPFESLPTEVQENVFKQLKHNTPTILKCMCVCKNWNFLFQKLLYNCVWLKDDLQLNQFNESIMENRSLKSLVKDLNFDFSEGYYHMRHDFAFLFAQLPNVERIAFHGQLFFSFLFKALSLNQLPNLKHIEPIEYPAYYYHPKVYKKEVRAYAKCVILLKDRLKNLTIVESDGEESTDENAGDSDQEELITSRNFNLFEKLIHFKNLQELHIEKRWDDIIELFEKLTSYCPHLQQLDVKIIPVHSSPPNTNSAAVPPNFTPSFNINHLKFTGPLFNNAQLLNYIMDKFPHLNTIVVRNNNKSRLSTAYLDNTTIVKLMNYLSKIKNVVFSSIPCNVEDMNSIITSFWSTANQTHLLSVRFLSAKNERRIMHINPTDGGFTCTLYISPHPSNAGLKFISALEKIGGYTDQLILTEMDANELNLLQQPSNTLFEFLILQPLKYCDKLKQFSVIGSTLTGSDVKGYEICKSQTFDTLKFASCIIEENGFYERLTQFFDTVKTLELHGIRNVDDPDDIRTAYANINMVETDIGKLILGEHRGNDNDVLVVKLLIGQSHNYYKYDLSKHSGGTETYKNFIPISKEDYDKELSLDNRVLIGITCKSLQVLDVQYSSKCSKLLLY